MPLEGPPPKSPYKRYVEASPPGSARVAPLPLEGLPVVGRAAPPAEGGEETLVHPSQEERNKLIPTEPTGQQTEIGQWRP
eukprot:5578843-Pyramimonas_sp.AAC.1